jgi:hypothetical protein
MRYRDAPLRPADELRDGSARYQVERVEPPPNSTAFGHAWVKRTEEA